MPRIDIRCLTCDTVSEVFRPLSEWPQTPACPSCSAPTEQIHLPKHIQTYAPAVVVYKAPDGSFRFPGSDDPNSRTAKQYAKLGYERQEHRGFAEVRRLEATVSKQQGSEIRRRVERQREMHERGMSERRSEVRRGLEQGFAIPEVDKHGKPTGRMKTVRLGAHGRDIMAAAMAKNDGRPGPKSFESGFHVDAYANDRSNRDESRREDGHRYRD